MTAHVFVGPTLSPDEVHGVLPRARVHGPVRHGDLPALDVAAADTVLLLDGVLGPATPVRHQEITDVLARGTRVVGASGTGALRAAELWPYGMEGVGLVFSMYVRGTLCSDDEVAAGRPPAGTHHRPTVPLVNVRWTVSNAVAEDVLPAEHGAELLEAARSLPYTERSWQAIERAARRLFPAAAESVAALREFAELRPDSCDLQRRDALLALSHCASAPRPVAPDLTDAARLVPRTMDLERWLGAFRPAVRDRHSPPVGELDVLRFQQLYAPDFPTRYRRFALTRIAGRRTAAEDRGLAHAALTAAARLGLSAADLPQAAWHHWLTPREMRTGSDERRLLKLLVRSFRSAPGTAPFYGVPEELRGTEAVWAASADAVAAAAHLDRRAARTGGHRAPRDLPADVVRQHLVEVWSAKEPGALEAAARDRGFPSLAEAEEAARAFVPLHHVRRSGGSTGA